MRKTALLLGVVCLVNLVILFQLAKTGTVLKGGIENHSLMDANVVLERLSSIGNIALPIGLVVVLVSLFWFKQMNSWEKVTAIVNWIAYSSMLCVWAIGGWLYCLLTSAGSKDLALRVSTWWWH